MIETNHRLLDGSGTVGEELLSIIRMLPRVDDDDSSEVGNVMDSEAMAKAVRDLYGIEAPTNAAIITNLSPTAKDGPA